jgi:hypothetical protein
MTDAVTGPFVVWADPVPNLRRGNAKLATHVAFRALHCRPRLRIEKSCAMEIPVRRFRGLQLGWNISLPKDDVISMSTSTRNRHAPEFQAQVFGEAL